MVGFWNLTLVDCVDDEPNLFVFFTRKLGVTYSENSSSVVN